MSISMRILNGNRKDEEFKVQAGVRIGRKQADLKIKDPKMSSTHAEIVENDGKFFLRDCGSRNKIIIGDRVLEEVELYDEMRFQLGETLFEVTIDSPEDSAKAMIIENLKDLETKLQNKENKIYAFQNKVSLRFLTGPEAGTNMPLGYGPRTAGKDSIDIRISENFDKTDLFYIEEKKGSLKLITKHCEHLLLNGAQASEENDIENNTILEFANTKIQIEILEWSA